MRLVTCCLFLSLPLFAAPRIEVSFSREVRATAADGRVIVIISKSMQGEPRFQAAWGLQTQQLFGLTVDGLRPGDVATLDASATGYPLRSLKDLPPGAYNVQAVLHLYETFHRADGHTVKLPMDDGEGQHWNTSPGNLLSKPMTVNVAADSVVKIEMTEMIPPIELPKDTKYVRHLRMESKLLSKFWGRPMHLGAIVLVPEGFDEHPQQHYPVAFLQGHFPAAFPRFRESPPEPGLKGPAKARADAAYRFYQEWASGRLPKMLIVETQHPTPYYDDSYGVNTANSGPYGDALTQELYPALEKKFRAIGEPWARVVFGGSTGGWMTLAQQIFYPEYFGGAWGFCPDPVDFHAFQLINVYKDRNAFFDEGPWLNIPRPLGRLPDGHTLMTMEDFTRSELVIGDRGRSGGQMDAFHATFGPAGPDGYPAQLWDSTTGRINPEVAKYWTEHFDLTRILSRNWEQLGPKLIGKIHVTMGTKDTFYLDAAARKMEAFLESTKLPGKGPYYGGSFEYGNNKPHCWAGDIPEGQAVEMYYLPIFADHMRKMAPKDADTESWR
jgi:enterochelin esterase-like enzyme